MWLEEQSKFWVEQREFFYVVPLARSLFGRCPDNRNLPLNLVLVCGILNVRTGLEIFHDHSGMAKTVQTV